MPTREQRLNQDWKWALSEGSRHFEEKSAIQDALRKIARRLTDLGVPFESLGGSLDPLDSIGLELVRFGVVVPLPLP
ncbi:hypothetical protein SAMN05444166_4155 [Singulisphaera sp. GP187]|uniref:hypothetical protein n=1 Tax=Singulisphaera sp. GP187 TaxID=1882752 RepID=UPI00092BCB27|nr:hypothetical protein [Singulisphaera sp. GP187]SIO36969.1 hypothetical protein SAMN05444166_4155 [Singulisphaera sp. GP187]